MTEPKKGIIRRFFSALFKTISWLRVALINLLFVVFFVVFITAIMNNAPVVDIEEGSVLLIAPEGVVVEEASVLDPIEAILATQDEDVETRLWDITTAIKEAASDKRIAALVLKLDGLSGLGMVKAEEIARALQVFKQAGKPVISYGEYYSQANYYLSAQADEVFMNPMGGVLLQGFGVYRNFFKSLLDTLKVNFHVFRVGEYKSALEPFMRDTMSEEAKQANLHWLNQVWNGYLTSIAEARNLNVETLATTIEHSDEALREVNGDAAALAIKMGLVDDLFDRPSMEEELINRFGESADGGLKAVSMRAYLNQHIMSVQESSDPEIAVIVAQGEIIDGESVPGAVGGDSLADLIQRASEDDSIHALVLRVDSPGGSVTASEVIRKELQRFQASGKPVVISMSSLAASGGYWIAAGADKIFADANTITGSIGIFGAIPTLEESLSHVGVSTDGVGTTPLANAFRIDMPMNPMAASLIQQNIEFGYRQFLEIVASGRAMDVEQVDAIARGRVWTGFDALEKGLVDGNGGLDDALQAAAEIAELGDNYKPKWIRPEMAPLQALVDGFLNAQSDVLMSWVKGFGLQSLALKQAWLLQDPRHRYVLCAECAPL